MPTWEPQGSLVGKPSVIKLVISKTEEAHPTPVWASSHGWRGCACFCMGGGGLGAEKHSPLAASWYPSLSSLVPSSLQELEKERRDVGEDRVVARQPQHS